MLEDVSCQKSFGVKVMTLTATPFLVAAKNFPLPPPPRGQHRPPPQLTCRLWDQLPSKYKPPIMDAISLTETVALPCIELKILALRTTTWVTQTAMTLTQRKCARIKNRPQISCLGICKFFYFCKYVFYFLNGAWSILDITFGFNSARYFRILSSLLKLRC